ncbi:MAG: Synechococcus phage [Bacteroidota bacterium]|jgi:hypothetical protein
MATRYGKRIVTDGLVLCLDAADNISAPHNDLPVKQGLLAWWDAADDSTVTLSGSNVTQWRDKSGNSYHMSPSGTGPTRSNTQNSKSVLTFTAAQDIRDNSTDLNLTTTTHTVVVVSRYTTGNLLYTNNAGRILQGVSNNWLLGAWDSQPSKYYAAGWVTSSSRVSTNDTTWGIHTGTGDYSNDVWAYIKNGTDLTVSSGGGGGGPNRLSINSGAINENSPCEVAELIVFNRVLSSDELTKVHNYLQNKWNIEVSDAKWYDRTANAYDGTPANGPIYSETNKGYFDFDGTNDQIAIGNLGSFSTFTVEVLFKSDSVTNYKNIMDCNWLTDNATYSNSGPRLEQYTSGSLAWVIGPGDGTYYGITIGSISSSQWVHAVITKTGTSSFVGYLNIPGTNASQNGSFTGWYGSLDDVVVGKGFNNSRYYDGKVALVRIYNKALSSDEVLQNYNATKGRYL